MAKLFIYDSDGVYREIGTADQQAHIADAPAGGTGAVAGGWDTAEHRDAAIATINAILDVLEAYGLVAKS